MVDENMESKQLPTAKLLMEAFMMMVRTFRDDPSGIPGCKRSHVMLLYCLKQASEAEALGLRISDISKRLKVTSPTVTQWVNELEAGGLVVRKGDGEDRRVVRVQLSDKGEQVLMKVKDVWLQTFNGLVEHLGEQESQSLAASLVKAVSYMQQQRDRLKQTSLGGDMSCSNWSDS